MDRPWRQYFGRKNQNQQVAPHKTMTEETNDDIRFAILMFYSIT